MALFGQDHPHIGNSWGDLGHMAGTWKERTQKVFWDQFLQNRRQQRSLEEARPPLGESDFAGLDQYVSLAKGVPYAPSRPEEFSFLAHGAPLGEIAAPHAMGPSPLGAVSDQADQVRAAQAYVDASRRRAEPAAYQPRAQRDAAAEAREEASRSRNARIASLGEPTRAPMPETPLGAAPSIGPGADVGTALGAGAEPDLGVHWIDASVPASMAIQPPAPALQVGAVRRGYRYRGGDPGHRTAWEKL